MSYLKSTIQLLVLPKDKKFHISPLFTGQPAIVADQLDQGIRALKKEIKYYLSTYYTFSRHNADLLLWLLFNPDTKIDSDSIFVRLPRPHTDSYFIVNYVLYEMRGFTFAVLPAFDFYQFMVKDDLSLEEQLSNVVSELFKIHINGLDRKETFDIEGFTLPNKTFTHSIEMNLNIQLSDFSFHQEQRNNFFDLMQDSREFDGAVEIHKIGRELNELYPEEINRAYQRDELADRLRHQIFNGTRTPIVLVGKRGVGKKTLVHEALYRYLKQFHSVRSDRSSQKIYHINPNRVIAGMSVIGWWTRRFTKIVDYASERFEEENENWRREKELSDHLLFDNPVALLRIGQTSKSNLTLQNVLIPYLEKRAVGVIILATPEEWQVVQEKSRRFADLFQIIRIPEMKYKESVLTVIEQRRNLEREHFCKIQISAIEQVFTLQRNFLYRQALPGSVMKILNQLASRYRNGTVDLEEVRENFQQFSGLRQNIFDEDEELEANEVEDFITQQLVGQPAAVKALAATIHQIKAKLHNPRKPFGSFMFIGPTGVGKTQAAKVLAQYLTGSEDQLLRFDMNEFLGPDAVDRLIGSYGQPEGLLTGKVRYQPFGIILLDEIEKAHPSVPDLLLQVLDDGRLTDSLGRTVDFTNTIIIMTSNVGARDVSTQLGFDTSNRSDRAIYESALKKQFRPEFINRIDQVVIFDPLTFDHILNIARLQIEELLSRDGFVRRTTILNVSKDALNWVARRGFDSKMGGRALKRQIERDLTMLSAEQLLATQGDLPILFEIDVDNVNNQLVPTIEVLSFADAAKNKLPDLPEFGKGRAFLRKKLAVLEKLEREINRMSEEEDDKPLVISASDDPKALDWEFYNFKNNLAALKEEINTLVLGYNNNYYRPEKTQNYRFKRAIFPTDEEGVIIENHLLDKDSLAQITENYRYALPAYDNMAAELLAAHIDVSVMSKAASYFISGKSDTLHLSLASLIDENGKDEMDFLLKQYGNVFQKLGLGFKSNEKEHSIKVSGYGIADLLKSEAGYSLFYQSHKNPIPIVTNIQIEDLKKDAQPKPEKVLRIFDLQRTMTDLRTGLTNVAQLNTEEFLVLITGA